MIFYRYCVFMLSLLTGLILLLASCEKETGGDLSVKEGLSGIPGEEDLPRVVPYLDCRPSADDGQGTAVLTPNGPLPIGAETDFEIVFTVGENGVAPGGFVMLQISPWWGWSQPQTEIPGVPGYTRVRTSFTDPSLKVRTLPLNRILVYSMKRKFQAGDTITFYYGNRARVDKFAEAEELFQIFVDAEGDGHSACIQNPPTFRTIAASPAALAVTVTSILEPEETTEVKVAPIDPLGNWSTFPEGLYSLRTHVMGKDTVITTRRLNDGEKSISFKVTPKEEGPTFFSVEGPSGLKGKSNVMLCQKGEPRLKLYFGDIHGHSRLSDGTGTPEDYYRYARIVSGLDIAALTDHSDYGTIPVRGPIWERIKKAACDAHVPGRFITFLGFEWTNWVYGHRNVYYRDGDGPVFRSIDKISDTPQKLWRLLEPHEAMTVAHHVGGGPMATDWNIPPGPKEWLVEISSIHGSSEYFGGEACIYSPVKGAFVRDALARDYKLGIMGSGDTHDGHPGQRAMGARFSGLLAVYSPELTRNDVWRAFKKRHVYGTSGPKIILNFQVAHSPMGSEISWKASNGAIPLSVRAVGCDDIAVVEIIRNGKTLLHDKGEGVFMQFAATDPAPLPGTSWYYVRVLQEDGNMAWSSPVWVTME